MEWVSQSAQAGGYWQVVFEQAQPSILPIGYRLQSGAADLVLFQQSGNRCLFLSKHEVSPAETFTPVLPKTSPAWQISSEHEPTLPTDRTFLLLGSDLSIARVFHFVQTYGASHHLVALLHTSDHFPFQVKPAQFLFDGFPAEAIGACPLLEDWKTLNRLCSDSGQPGCYEGSLEALFEEWSVPKEWEIIDLRRD